MILSAIDGRDEGFGLGLEVAVDGTRRRADRKTLRFNRRFASAVKTVSMCGFGCIRPSRGVHLLASSFTASRFAAETTKVALPVGT